jgi:hypothetical protein
MHNVLSLSYREQNDCGECAERVCSDPCTYPSLLGAGSTQKQKILVQGLIYSLSNRVTRMI